MPLKAKKRESTFELQSENILDNLDELAGNEVYRHQVEAVRKLRTELFTDHSQDSHLSNVSLAVLPTGSGKSGVAVLAAYACAPKRVLVITPSVTISKQLWIDFVDKREDKRINPLKCKPFLLEREVFEEEDMKSWMPEAMCALRSSRELQTALDKQCELVIANAQKFGGGDVNRGINIGSIDNNYFALVIVDEAHHYPAETWRRIVHHFKAKIIFLTATPLNRGNYILTDEKKPCYTYKREDAIRDGIIRPTTFIEIPGKEDDRDTQILKVLKEVVNVLQQHDREDPGPDYVHKAMVIAPSVDDAHNIKDIWEKQIHHHNWKLDHFLQKDPSTRVQDFKNPRHDIRVLVVIYRLMEGFDCKNVSVAAILRNVQPQSRVYFTQVVGRAVRKAHKDDPVTATVISHEVHKQQQNYDTFNQEILAEDDPEDPEDMPEDDEDEDMPEDNDLEEPTSMEY